MESLELLVPYRKLHAWRSELLLASDFIYVAFTSARGKQTLGEEYVNIMPYHGPAGKFPSLTRRATYFLISIIGPYIVARLVRKAEQPLSSYLFNLS